MTAPNEDILLNKLQQTIHLWSDEVTQAHSGLTQQISETRNQLSTLIDTISKRSALSNATGTETSTELPSSPQELQRSQIALTETIAHNKLLLKDLEALKSDYEALQQKHIHTISLNQKLASSLKTLQSRKLTVTAERDSLKQEIEKRIAEQGNRDENQELIQGEMEHLVETANQAISLQEELLQDRNKLLAKNQDLESQCEAAAQLQEQHIDLKNQLQELQTNSSQHAEDMTAAHTKISELESERTLISEELEKARAQINHLQDHAQLAAAQSIQELKVELNEKDAALAQIQHELSSRSELHHSIQSNESELKIENTKLKNQLSNLKQQELDLKSDLASLGQEYERQAEVLRDAVNEVEAHWKLESEARDREQHLKVEIDTLNDQLKEKNDRLLQVEQETSAPIISEPSTPSIPVTASGKSEQDLEELHMDLITLENFLKEREKSVEIAAEKMQFLEQTAMAVQSEVNALREEHQRRLNQPESLTTEALQKAEEEITLLKKSFDQQTQISDTQQEVIDEQFRAMDKFKHELIELQAAHVDSIQSGDQLQEALTEIETLKISLKQRESELQELKTITAPSAAFTPYTFSAFDDNGTKRSMGEILVEAGIINKDQLTNALEEQQTTGQRRLGSILVEKGHIREEIVAQVVASQLKLPFVRIEEEKADPEAITLLNAKLAAQHTVFPIRTLNNDLILAMSNPLDLIAIEDLEFATHKKITPAVATQSDIVQAIVKHYGIAIPANAAKTKPAAAPQTSTPDNESI